MISLMKKLLLEYCNALNHRRSHENLQHFFRTDFPVNTSEGLLLFTAISRIRATREFMNSKTYLVRLVRCSCLICIERQRI